MPANDLVPRTIVRVFYRRLTAYWEYDLSSWDVAAGSILIEEAGGKMTDLKGERWNLRTRKICGSNGGKVHEQILKALEEANVV